MMEKGGEMSGSECTMAGIGPMLSMQFVCFCVPGKVMLEAVRALQEQTLTGGFLLFHQHILHPSKLWQPGVNPMLCAVSHRSRGK